MPWEREDIKRLIELESHVRGIDPRLGLALAEQESSFDPRARSPKGAMGIFQLMPGTARQLKVDPSDVAQNISGGLDYLKQQLDAFGGDPAKAIAAYNAGPGVVQAYKGVPPYKETRGLVSRVMGSLGPSSAEAATPQAQPQSAGMTRLQELEAHLARLEGQAAAQPAAPATTPSPPTARSTPEQDAAYRASREQQEPATAPQTPVTTLTQPGASQAPPEPQPDPSATPGMRFQALPSITQLEPQDRLQKTKLFESLKPALQEEFLRSEEPAAGGLAMGGGPVAQSQPVTDPLALLAVGRGAPSREQQILAEARARQQRGETKAEPGWRGVPPEAPLEEGITSPSTMIPLLMTGAGVKAVAPYVAKAGPLITRGARAAAEGLSQTAGWTAGRTAETGKVPSAGDIGTEAALNVATGGLIEGLGAGRQALLRRSQAGRAIQQEGQAVIPEAYTQAVEGQRQAIQTARAVPGRYTPETPSWTMYERFNDVAKNQEVDLLTAKTALADVRAGRGVLPDGSLRPFPQSVEKIANSLEGAGDVASVQTIQQELRRLGPLTRHADGNIRGPAKQLYGIYADALESSPAANELLRSANATFRKEMALQDVQEWLRPGHGVIRIDNQGREVINPGQLMTRLEKKLGDDTLFARSFSPEELQGLRTDIGAIAGTPTMPREGPPAGPTAKEILGKQPPWKGHTTTLGAMALVMNQLGVPAEITTALTAAGAVHLVQKQSRWLLANALLNPKRRALMEAAIDGRGGLNPRLYGFLIATLSPEEKQAYERETKAKGR